MKTMLALALISVSTLSFASEDICKSPKNSSEQKEINAKFNKIACQGADSLSYFNDYQNPKSFCVQHTITRRECTSAAKTRYIDATVSYGRNSGQVSRGAVRYDDRADCRVWLSSANKIKSVDCSKID